jgi:PAS domain S-box-containing protein
VILGLILVIRFYLNATGKKKKQAKFVSIALSIPIVFSIVAEVAPLVLQTSIPDLSPVYTTALCVVVGYAIWKYDLFTLSLENAAETIISTMPDSLILINSEGKILAVNQRLVDLLGYSQDELVLKPVDLLFNEKEFTGKLLDVLVRNEELQNYETTYKTKSTKEIPVSVSASVVQNKSDEIVGVVVVVRDITEKKQMEQLLLKSEKMAVLGQAATMVGHDLRNPLQSIQNATYCIKKELSDTKATDPPLENSHRMLQLIENSIEYSNNIVLDLKDFSSERKPMISKVDVNEIVQDSLMSCKVPKNVKLTTDLPQLPPISIDKAMIKRIFVNIITNGIQSMPEGGTFKISTTKTESSVEVRFQDSGKGMTKETRKKLFTPFFTTKAQGMGMGLAICKKFIDLNGGSIEVDSKEGKGTTFTIKLPINT